MKFKMLLIGSLLLNATLFIFNYSPERKAVFPSTPYILDANFFHSLDNIIITYDGLKTSAKILNDHDIPFTVNGQTVEQSDLIKDWPYKTFESSIELDENSNVLAVRFIQKDR
ncbi:hypothetical protein EHV15_35915 [Paenibacillus oralis]|uniref:Uncharacterized protein n=1 Tax=Paenibacillus oralis TaxID=2490856 RepID=A0A3P3TAI8_9BACL|nr:hypothetical protein [Paenibacillus oralis]RRJ54960.1 hypothetical protein EHV15_35915 [Paenibacillus oralis]